MITTECRVTQHSEYSGGAEFSTFFVTKTLSVQGMRRNIQEIRHRTGNQTVNIFTFYCKIQQVTRTVTNCVHELLYVHGELVYTACIKLCPN